MFGKTDIVMYLIEKGATAILESVLIAITHLQTDCVVHVLKNHPTDLKICFDEHNMAILGWYCSQIPNTEIISKISPLIERCPCLVPLSHMVHGPTGIQGPRGACGIGMVIERNPNADRI